MKLVKRFTLAGLLLVGLGACGAAKKAAERDIAMADSTVAAVEADAQKVVPDRLTAVKASIDEAKSKLAASDYKGASEAAKTANTAALALTDEISARKTELTTEFTNMSKELPAQIDSVEAKLNQVTKTKRLPAGLDTAKVNALKTDFANIKADWTAADAAFRAGELASAVAKARQVRTKVTEAKATLGMTKA